MRSRAILALVLALVATACGEGRNEPERKLLRFVGETQPEARSFVYQEGDPCPLRDPAEATPDDTLCAEWQPNVVVRGRVEDDLRFHATLEVAGAKWVEQVVYDDALAVRLFDPAKSFATEIGGDDQEAVRALSEGRWVVDYQGAPPLLAPVTREGSPEVGTFPILDAAYVFQYIRRAIEDAAGVIEFDPDSLTYQPIDDPFTRPDDDEAERRIDIVAPPLPRRSQRGTQSAQPTIAHFRKMAFYVVGERVVRVVEQIDIETQRDFRRAQEGTAAEYYLELLESVKKGNTREPVRERRMVLEIVSERDAPEIALPLGDAVTAGLTDAIGPRGIGLHRAPAQAEEESSEDAGSEPPDGGGA